MEKYSMLRLLAAAGLGLSVYALWVKQKLKLVDGYRPICDIRGNISCTKALGSRYSTTAGVQNPLLGILYYIGVIVLTFFQPRFILFPATAAVLFSLYLAFVSYAVQRNFCLVCSATYLVNIGILATAIGI
jgi:uncharacterized membrane protein